MNNTTMELKQLDVAPFLFRVAKWLQRKNIRGGFRLEDMCRSWGLLEVKVRYTLSNGVLIDIPINDRPYDLNDILNYESHSIAQISALLSRYPNPFILLDCGADIGLMSARLVASCPNIKQVIAFEPNKTSFTYLNDNLQLLTVPAEAKNYGVSDFKGTAELQCPSFDSHAHAAFIVPSENGSIAISTIDDLALPKNSCIVLKVDVEGEELSVIKGAAETIRTAAQFVIIFEAHFKQVARRKIDPITVITFIKNIKPCKVSIMELAGVEIALDKPFFEQFPEGIYNICAYTE